MNPITVGSAALTTIVLWAWAYVGIRQVVEVWGPIPLAAGRYLIAALVLLPFALRGPRPTRNEYGRLFLAGAVGIAGYNVCINLGLSHVDAGSASLLVQIAPLIGAAGASWWLGESLRLRGWLGFVSCFAGVCLVTVVDRGAGPVNWHALWLVLAAVCAASYALLMKPLVQRLGALTGTAWLVAAGALTLSPFLPATARALPHATATEVIVLVLLALGPGALAYSLWGLVLKHWGVQKPAVLLYLIPPVAALGGFLFLGELPGYGMLLGGPLIIGGILLVTWGGNSRGSTRAAPER